ncbi:MAG: DUF5694 domain-containing protein, partial [Nocardioidaceae bacterium]
MTSRVPEPVQVLLLGTPHLANPGLDMANAQVDDVLTPGRQREIVTVVEHLARFQPTKVAVERPHDQRAAVASAYERFLSDGAGQSRDEAVQIGFRLAALVKHSSVLGIDAMDQFYLPEIEPLVEQGGRNGQLWTSLMAAGSESTADVERLLAGSLGSVLRLMNGREARAQGLSPYMDYLLPIRGDDSWAGADMVGNWYRRNFRIAANLDAETE